MDSTDREYWETMSQRSLTEAELVEIRVNLARFARLLIAQAKLIQTDRRPVIMQATQMGAEA